MKTKKLISLLLILIGLSSCHKNNRFEIDTTKNRIEVKIQRFDSAVIAFDTTGNKGIKSLYTKYKEFLPTFTSEIINTESKDTASVRKLLIQFKTDRIFADVNQKAITTFENVSDIEKKISDAFTYIHYYFPEVKLPKIYFYVSGFNRAVLMNDNFMGIGTDFYLGSDYAPYKEFTYSYLLYNMRRECVASDVVSATLFKTFAINSTEERLLDNMLFRGKVMYLLAQFMPSEKQEELMGYSPKQWEWCKNNEKGIWTAIIDQKDLFSTDMLLVRKYMNDAPFTTPISQESPGRLGTWIGWQIVESYMKKNEKVGLQDLMKEHNYQKILEDSGYRPQGVGVLGSGAEQYLQKRGCLKTLFEAVFFLSLFLVNN